MPTDPKGGALPINPIPNVRTREFAPDTMSAAQGPAPTDFAEREIPPTPLPSGQGLGAGQVEAMLSAHGQDSAAVQANGDLAAVQGRAPTGS
ncbi:hypothetical protein [Deinococcus hopiensis]|uniref:Uncharacterized protein n=1 Tax=Deinococcus hopiensis KR-140 TaxID=695939 RepID=A0A1W1VRW5_9DEIO|nr:hypothetical protein [Deinococcus hopiensis]SMB96115.1 hypothetical protein SAMN00790413_03160 [Deinococcus hopiensis KR-140]